MLITLTCHAPSAPEIGYLLGKNPASVFERPFSAGTVWVFYPEVADDHVTIALLTEIDAVGLVRGPTAFVNLDHYVNDRPYVVSSLTSVAINTAFGSALAGRCTSHAERLNEKMLWDVSLPAVACDAGEEFMDRIFSPLGYTLTTTRPPLDPYFPAWGQSCVYTVRLEGLQTVKDLLSHLYVLLPVLDNSKHYFVGADEADKLLSHGGPWLAAHPERELIARRYLRYKRPLVQSTLDRLMENTPSEAAADERDAPTVTDPVEQAMGLHEQRLSAAIAAAREIGAHSLVDLGCGEGRLLSLAMRERELTRVLGMDVSSAALARAHRRLRLDTLPQPQRERIELMQGSLLYRDQRLAGFDIAALIEVIEHLDAPRLSAMERVIFQHARPRRIVVTTPNREYNVRWEALGAERLRHSDHRFEWTRSECRTWGEHVAATFGYRATHQEIGPADPEVGAPSHLVIFDRLDALSPASSPPETEYES